jgi:hypothetical protein
VRLHCALGLSSSVEGFPSNAFAAQLIERVGFDVAEAAFGAAAFQIVVWDLRGHIDEQERRGSRCDDQQHDQGVTERVHPALTHWWRMSCNMVVDISRDCAQANLRPDGQAAEPD